MAHRLLVSGARQRERKHGAVKKRRAHLTRGPSLTMPSSSFNQRTLSGPIGCDGVGLDPGQAVKITLRPAPADHGIVFVRTDLPTPVEIPAIARYVVNTELATTLGREGAQIGTVEHLLAALSGLGIDNVRIELDGPEV